MMSKMVAFSMVFVCFAVFVNSFQIKINKSLENQYRKKYGAGKPVEWTEISKMTKEQLAEVCKTVHLKTNHGPLQDKDLKEVTVEDAFLEFSSPKLKKTPTQVLSCKKNNKEEYVYHLVKALSKDSVMLVYLTKDAKSQNVQYEGKNVFHFTRHEPIRNIPILQKA